MGGELGGFATEDYTETKTLQLHLGARTDWYLPR
jgi:betaine-aldehyde dehydrogenase